MRVRRRLTRIVPLALVAATVFSCNGLLDNEVPHLEPNGGEAGDGAEASGGRSRASGGTSNRGGGEGTAGGTDGLAGATDGGAPSNGGSAGAAGAAGSNASSSGGVANARGGSSSAGGGAPGLGGAVASGGAAPTTCPTTVDCALSVCDGKACGANGRKCASGACSCPGGATRETSCSDGADNDCDGAVDCADSDCPERTQCGSAANSRCCGGACVNTESDPNNCQACGSKCASGKSCVLLSDSYGRRGHCQCAGTNSLCPGHKSSSPTIICRTDTPNANLCAQEAASVCPAGQTFVDVSGGPNFCHY